MSFFSIRTEPRLDPILVAFQDFVADPRPQKVNLSVGMYFDAAGRIPVLRAVAEAEAALFRRGAPWGYSMAEGIASFRQRAARLLFGDALLDRIGPRLATIQTLGGTGAVRLGAEMIRATQPGAGVALSRPTWLNHPAIFEAAGLPIAEYDYYDPRSSGVDFAAMCRSLDALPRGSVVVLHGCCHNPTGADLTPAEWETLAALMVRRGLAAFLDIAYAGFGEGLEADLSPVGLLVDAGVPLLVSLSFSKSFSLYGERVGLLAVLTESPQDAHALTEAMKGWSRAIYSTPPAHGALLVAEVLGSPDLEAQWRAEVEEMRGRIQATRHALVHRIAGNAAAPGLDFLTRQKGLFSYTGLTAGQVARLKDEYAIHAVSDGRICVSAVNDANLAHVADGLRAVMHPVQDAA